jgi:hypothetical protein
MSSFAAFTMVRNEPLFLPLWLNYYTKVFGQENCYVIDNETTDESIVQARIDFPNVHFEERKTPNSTYGDWLWALSTVTDFQHQLLKSHQIVIYNDVDEFLLVRPGGKYKDLNDACEQLSADPNRPFIMADGHHIIHQPSEPGIVRVPGESALKDRQLCMKLNNYCKTLVCKVPMHWSAGFHKCMWNGRGSNRDHRDLDLVLMHLWLLDNDEFMRRHKGKERRVPNSEFLSAYDYGMTKAQNGPQVIIPEEWRQALVW